MSKPNEAFKYLIIEIFCFKIIIRKNKTNTFVQNIISINFELIQLKKL